MEEKIYLHKLNYFALVEPRDTTAEEICSKCYPKKPSNQVLAEVNGQLFDMNSPLRKFCFMRFVQKEFGISTEEEWYEAQEKMFTEQKKISDATRSDPVKRIIMTAVIEGTNRIFYAHAGTLSTLEVVRIVCSHHEVHTVTETSHLFRVNGEDIDDPNIKLTDHSIIEFFEPKSVKEEMANDRRDEGEITVAIMSRDFEIRNDLLTPSDFFKQHYSSDISIDSFITLVDYKVSDSYVKLQKDSNLMFVNAQTNIKDHLFRHSISFSDEQIKKCWFELMMIHHSFLCGLIKGRICLLPLCNKFFPIIEHVTGCPNKTKCSTLNCTNVRKALSHKSNCKLVKENEESETKQQCLYCDAIDHSLKYQPHPMSSNCVKNKKNSDIIFVDLPKDCSSSNQSQRIAGQHLPSSSSIVSDPSLDNNQPSNSPGDTHEMNASSSDTGYETLSPLIDGDSFAKLSIKRYKEIVKANSSEASSSIQYCGSSVSSKGDSFKNLSLPSTSRQHRETISPAINQNLLFFASQIYTYESTSTGNPILTKTVALIPSDQSLSIPQQIFLVNPDFPCIIYPESRLTIQDSEDFQQVNISSASVAQASANTDFQDAAASDIQNQTSDGGSVMLDPVLASRDPTSNNPQVQVQQHFSEGTHSKPTMVSAGGSSVKQDREDKNSPLKKRKLRELISDS